MPMGSSPGCREVGADARMAVGRQVGWAAGSPWQPAVGLEESVSSDQGDSTFELRACCPGMRTVRSRAGEALLAEAPGTRKPL